MEMVLHWFVHHEYLGIFSLLTLGVVGIPVPNETLLVFAGYLVYKGDLDLASTIAVSFLGALCGISLSYTLGRTAGIYLIGKYGHIIRITADKVRQVQYWFGRAGRWGLIFGYFIPRVKSLMGFVAGVSGVELSVFTPFAYAGGLIWSITFISIGYFLGEKWVWLFLRIRHYLVIGASIAIILVLLCFLVQFRRSKTV